VTERGEPFGFTPREGDELYCYLTTTGRTSGEPREIEIWFGLEGRTLYMLSGGGDRSNWVRNLIREPRVKVRIAEREMAGTARVVEDSGERERARALLAAKYGMEHSGWRRTGLPIAVDLREARPAGSRRPGAGRGR
jgi:deazaflavin-dependent oxidoreductase (nitroreductase family)